MPGMCKDCVSGHLHPAPNLHGREETVHGLPTYVCDPPDAAAESPPKGLVVVIADGFGWTLPNNRVLTDTLARRTGCRVLLPDFFAGHWLGHGLLNAPVELFERPASLWELGEKA